MMPGLLVAILVFYAFFATCCWREEYFSAVYWREAHRKDFLLSQGRRHDKTTSDQRVETTSESGTIQTEEHKKDPHGRTHKGAH